ncbi:PadR family transcriptional regulator [Devosia nitrariae]|uniref:PadR family transcriptional regulator n=2 Tax=Devosia nitrariae TaxID=2071872 RepID=A0ABQ5W2Y6_9HYPH|nr:PadR family transcriptional regulator [Devosia nitrariae]
MNMGRYFRDGEPDWRRLEAMARRNWHKFARMAGDESFGNWGGGWRIGRMLASGDLRLVALYLIDEQPRHGYDLIKAIEEKSEGFYSPSPGVVYPALTYLEEAGFVTSEADGNKKLYTITEEGRAHLADNREAIEKTLEFLARAGDQMRRFREFARGEWASGRERDEDVYEGFRRWRGEAPPRPDRDIADVLPEVNEARRELKAAIVKAVRGNEEHQRRLAEILRKAAADIRVIDAGDEDIDL